MNLLPERPARLAAGLLLAALFGCAGSPSISYYTLDNVPTQTPARTSTPSIVVLPAEVPETLDRPQLVVLTGDHRVEVSERHRWAAPLRREIPRLVADELGQRLTSAGIVALPYVPDAPLPDYRLTLTIARLDAIPGHGVRLDAHWRLQSRDGTLRRGHSAFDEPLIAGAGNGSGDERDARYAALVAAQARALRRLAGDIAQAVPR